MKIYQKIAQTLQALTNCDKSGNGCYYDYKQVLLDIERDYLPHGSGFDGTMLIDDIVSKGPAKKFVIRFDYHCMNDNGYYVGWLTLDLIVTPSLSHDFDLKLRWYINDNDRNLVAKYKPLLEDYLYDEFEYILNQEFEEKQEVKD